MVEVDQQAAGRRVEPVALVLAHGPRGLLLGAEVHEDDALGSTHGPQLAEALLLRMKSA